MIRKPLPSAAELRALFRYDPSRGLLFWRARASAYFNARFAGRAAGSLHYGFLCVGVKGWGILRVHRVIWKMMHDEEPEVVDHIDGNRANNRLRNLRAATCAQNNVNRRRSRGGPWRGVTRDHGRFVARIGSEGRRIHLGRFADPRDAHRAYRQAAERLYGAFARLD